LNTLPNVSLQSKLGNILTHDLVIKQEQALDLSATRSAQQSVPIGFKDMIDTADVPTEYGTPIHAGHRPRIDATCVALHKSNGITEAFHTKMEMMSRR
jgi:amidase